MRLYVEPMDAVVVEIEADGRVRYEVSGDRSSAADAADIEWSAPTLQERRAIIYCARKELEALTELLEILDPPPPRA